ncbi:ABC transporter ATP-binding protein [Neobacillus sp. PS3-12]|jgi:ABC-type multidrug transport system fused ATPase/permease subunit|uniref:ABC transporter ATP-binding protein n=1 Tax=Neobacillus sp. PS3-12 TaxID=3070677 RepID=UPI0027DF17E8|nr:ABC transporter ATP-binding protein [Neobacillus sp. PS3-12]WML51580.1 ABC transporter ATP-binding protein [Neobacillus sp. PS3-12]
MEQVFYYIKRLHTYSGKILYFNLIGMAIVSFIEGMGIFLLIPMLNYSGIFHVATGENRFIKYLNYIDLLPKTFVLIFILGFYILLVTVQNLVQRKLSIRNVKITNGFVRQLRLETYSGLLKASWGFYTKERKADLINIMTLELARVAGGINQFLVFLTSIVFTLIQIIIAFCLSAQLTIFVLFFGCILGFFSKKFIKQSKTLGNKTSLLAQEYLAGITDQLNGIKDIKSNMLEESRLNWLQSVTKGMIEEQIEYIQLKSSSQIFYKISSASLIAIFIFIYVTIFKVQPEQFLLILLIFSRLWPRITDIQSCLEQIASSVPAFKSLIDLNSKTNKALESSEFNNGNVQSLTIEDSLECRGVYFRYTQNENIYALKNIYLKIPANRMTAIVGPSGAGKSTLIDLLMGLNKSENGEVLIDGILLSNENLLSLRRSVSYVSQEPFLFNASIRENLLLIQPNSNEEELWKALDFSSAAEFVRKLPMGIDTIVGDRGIRLSGGERQRLVIARAILRKPSILVLDEATSALDTDNESKIQESLERLKGQMTIIVIAHRLSTIRNADQVIVLDQGKIIQQGGFKQLANEQKGMFNHLLKKQMEVSV